MGDDERPVSLERVQSEIEKQLECGLCLQCFHQPKVLPCNHIYCKSCLDKLLEFHADGSATINCPLKCEVPTAIECAKTTNDLGVNFYIQGIIDRISEKYGNKKTGTRCNEIKCDGKVSVFCYNCNFLLCTSCRNKHGILHEDNFVTVKFDEQEETLVVLCEEHKTAAEFVCFEPKCNSKFLCLYCVERCHKSHYKEQIGVKCARIKQWLDNQEEKTEDVENSMNDINDMLTKDDESIRGSRQSLECILKERIVNGMSLYLKNAEVAKTRLLNEFDIAVDIHKQSYPETNIVEFFDRFRNVEDVLVVLMEKNAIKYLAKLASAKINLPTVKMSLTDPTELNPLGKLKAQTGPQKSINDENSEANFMNSFDGCDEKHCNVSDFLESMEELVGKRDFNEESSVVSERTDCNELELDIKDMVDKSVQVIGATNYQEDVAGIDINPVALLNYGYKFFLCMSVFIATLSVVIGTIALAFGSYYFLPYIPYIAGRVDGGYSAWTQFSYCSKSCGKGLQTRERFCNNPVPRYGGKDCSALGKNKEMEACSVAACPMDGGYSDWTNFAPCSRSCGKGLRTRERFCNNPVPKHGGNGCSILGIDRETEQCNTSPCSVNGGYGEWIKWSTCTKSCNKGFRTRERICNNPTPQNGGTECSILGVNRETEQCNLHACPSPTFEFRFVNGQSETVKRSYPEYKAEFVGFGIGVLADGKDADRGTLRKRTSSLSECVKYCANQKRVDNRINGVQYEMYGNEVCFCEQNYATHRDRNDHLHYKLS